MAVYQTGSIILFVIFIFNCVETKNVPMHISSCLDGNYDKKDIDLKTFCEQNAEYFQKGDATVSYFDAFDLNLARAEAEWVNSLINKRTRVKRQTTPVNGKPRKEVRMMTQDEWGNFTVAVNLLKYDTVPGSNKKKYDTIANIARMNSNGTHDGPAFLGWNRAYVELFERALQEMIPGVTVPYWDSTKDFYMNDPKESVIWSWIFFGKGKGQVTNGPFANWSTSSEGPLYRDVGSTPSSLLTIHGINAILSSKDQSQITLPQDAPEKIKYTVEGQQNGVHPWVGGFMEFREFAPQDPIFFLHRAFVDYIWHKYIQKTGIDAAKEYPKKGGRMHDPENKMFYFITMTNRDGYKLEANYDDSPTCNSTNKECGTHWFKCTFFWVLRDHICISLTMKEALIEEDASTKSNMTDKRPELKGTPYEASFIDMRTESNGKI